MLMLRIVVKSPTRDDSVTWACSSVPTALRIKSPGAALTVIGSVNRPSAPACTEAITFPPASSALTSAFAKGASVAILEIETDC